MLQELLDGDVAEAVGVERGEVLRDRILEPDAPVVGEHEHRGADDRLGHRAHAKEAARLERELGFAIRVAEGRVLNRATVLDDEQLGADDFVCVDEPLDELVQARESGGRDAFGKWIGGGVRGRVGALVLGRRRRV